MIEDVKRLRPELKPDLFPDPEVLKQSPIEVNSVGIVQNVSAGSSKRQTARRSKGIRITKRGP